MNSPLYGPGRSRGFSNEESIHTASIQLTLSANPLSAPSLSAILLPFFLSFFPLRSLIHAAPLVRKVVPSTSRLRRATSAKSLLRARERGHVRHLLPPPPNPFFFSLRPPFNPFAKTLSLSLLESTFVRNNDLNLSKVAYTFASRCDDDLENFRGWSDFKTVTF